MSNIKIRGFDQHVRVPLTVLLEGEDGEDGAELKFSMSYLRMTRKDQAAMFKNADNRQKAALKIQKQIVAELEAVNEDGEPDVDQGKIAALEERIEDLGKKGEEASLARCKGWDLEDDDGNPVPFNKENLCTVADNPDVYIEIVNGMWVATGGRLKN